MTIGIDKIGLRPYVLRLEDLAAARDTDPGKGLLLKRTSVAPITEDIVHWLQLRQMIF